MKAQCLISFGSNLGSRDAVIADAARRIAATPGVGPLRASRLFETPPIGGPGGQEPFLNAIAAFETTRSAREILALLQETEGELGRQRQARWGARSIDLDVVLHGNLVGGGQGLIVPHPRYTARQFVLQPARDVAAHYRDPRFGWTLQRLAEHVSAGVPSLALIGGDEATRRVLCERLTAEHGIQTFPASPLTEPMAVVGNVPAAVRAHEAAARPRAAGDEPVPDGPIELARQEAWVSAYVPPLPPLDSPATFAAEMPRLVARMQWTTAESRWPAPHQIWPSGWSWPEYRLEIDDLDWAVSELASAIDSMRCPVSPVTETGRWWC